ncbi:MAG: hypothetical protein AAF962_09670 [Actinomycetota bacterium]
MTRAVLAAAILVAAVLSGGAAIANTGDSAACTTRGHSYAEARAAYDEECGRRLAECERSGAGYACSSDPIEIPDGTCHAVGDTYDAARDAYHQDCVAPLVDCDRSNPGFVCAGHRMSGDTAVALMAEAMAGAGPQPTTPPSVGPPTTSQPTSTTATTSPPADPPGGDQPDAPPTGEQAADGPVAPPTIDVAPPTPVEQADCAVIAFEAEAFDPIGAWSVQTAPDASGGAYLIWEGLNPGGNTRTPTDVMRLRFTVTTPGTYRFSWSMQQLPASVPGDRANDSWVNFPDADRFGPIGGGTYPGLIKVYGNSKNAFRYGATAESNHKHSRIGVRFDRAGTYTMELGGRSHGHALDRIVLYEQSLSVDRDTGVTCDRGEQSAPQVPGPAPVTTVPTVQTTPPGPSAPPATSGPFDPSTDLLSLHFDHAPDKDDGHAAVAGRELATALGLEPWVIGGAYAERIPDKYNPGSEAVMRAAWGDGWVNAHRDRAGAVRRTADRWQQVLSAGGDIWVAEGGHADLTADVVRELKDRMPGLATRNRIHVVQHSEVNESVSNKTDLGYVRSNTDYIKIDNGNYPDNGTADFTGGRNNTRFINCALGGRHGDAWQAAFTYLDPYKDKLDFSDTVEALHIVGIGLGRVADVHDFSEVVMGC